MSMFVKCEGCGGASVPTLSRIELHENPAMGHIIIYSLGCGGSIVDNKIFSCAGLQKEPTYTDYRLVDALFGIDPFNKMYVNQAVEKMQKKFPDADSSDVLRAAIFHCSTEGFDRNKRKLIEVQP